MKMEGENPGKSVKDRLAFGMIRDLEAAGEIAPVQHSPPRWE
eukprot:gene24275-50484_t